jgi:hypothetical protein
VIFDGAVFRDGRVNLYLAAFCGATVSFDDMVLEGGEILFDGAAFSGGEAR